jgi:hypothetical protein
MGASLRPAVLRKAYANALALISKAFPKGPRTAIVRRTNSCT